MVDVPSQMQVLNVLLPGKNSSLVKAQRAVPRPEAGQLLIQVKAAGVNRADLMQRQGHYPAPPGESDILGLEVAGIVVQVGAKADNGWLGQEVFGIVAGGGYAQYALLHQSHAIRKPPSWSWPQAGAAAETFLTAYQLLFILGDLKSGHKVIVHAGASGVGTSAIQLAKLTGAAVAVTVGQPEKAKACLQLGADFAINYQQSSFSDELKACWPAGADIILDPVAGDYVKENIKILAEDGAIIIYALMGGRMVEQLDLAVLFKKRGKLMCSTLRNRSNAYKAKLTAGFFDAFGTQMADGRLSPLLSEVFCWEEAQKAHNVMKNNNNIGKLVLAF